MSTCKHCGQPIRWATTEAGRNMPLDPDPTPSGNVALVDTAGAGTSPRAASIEDNVRSLLLWRQWLRRRARTSSSATARSAGITAAAPTAGDASCRKPRLATDRHLNGGRWTGPSGPRGSDPTSTTSTGRVYRSRSATPGLDRLATLRRVVCDVGAIVAVVSSMTLFGFGVFWVWRAMR